MANGLLEELPEQVDQLVAGAGLLDKGLRELERAETEMPAAPLQNVEDGSQWAISKAELDHVERYRQAASTIAKYALDAVRELNGSIAVWDRAVARTKTPRDVTRKPAVEAVSLIDLRFSNKGGSFHAYLVDTRDRAQRVYQFASAKLQESTSIIHATEHSVEPDDDDVWAGILKEKQEKEQRERERAKEWLRERF